MSRKVVGSAIVGLAATVSVMFASTAAAHPAKHPLPPQAQDLGGVVVAKGGGNADKAGVAEAVDAYVADIVTAAAAADKAKNDQADRTLAHRARPQRLTGSTSFHGSASRGWSCSSMDAGFGDSVSWPWWGETSADVSGSSSTHWWGGCPYNAGTVYMSDEICFDTISFGASFSGVGFSSSGGGCGTWSASLGNNWMISHYYNGVHGSAGIGTIYRVRQSTGGTYRFGTTYVGLNANGSAWI
jgi:hypothetical protein